jgi:hypothetical protein
MAASQGVVRQLLTEPDPADHAEATHALATPGVLRAVTIAASCVAAAIVMAMPWSPVSRYFSLPSSTTDIGTHVKLAEEIATNGIAFPHFLWHALVVAVHAAAPGLSWMDAAWMVVVGSYAFQGAVLAWILTSVLPPTKRSHPLGIVPLTLLLVTAAPVTILTWHEWALYFGYLNMDPYHSPTHALLKPLALVAFGFTAKGFADGGSVRHGLVVSAAVVLSALAKPSLMICLLPATVVLAAAYWLAGRRLHLVYLCSAIVVPAVAVLVWEYLSYFAPGGRSAIIFAPLLVMAHYATGLGPKFLMSILLPLAVLLVYGRQVLADPSMQLAWVQFAIAVGYTYLLAETRDTWAGNFAWTGQIATYLLFIASTVFVLRNPWSRSRTVPCALAFSLHAVSGVLFFAFPWSIGSIPAS